MQRLISLYTQYHPEPKVHRLNKAYELAEVAYLGEKRLNGEDWLNYSLEVAKLAAEMKLDTASICTALLVDSYKFGLTPEDIHSEMGPDVKEMLNSLENIRELSNRYSHTNLDQDYAEYIRRLILTTGKDIRVVALRLVQKLHALNSIYVFNKAHQDFILKKVFEIYAPLADLIGMGLLKRRLHETAFEMRDYQKYLMSRNLLSTNFFSKEYKIEEVVNELTRLLQENNVSGFEISGRIKDPYSFYIKALRYVERDSLDFFNASQNIYDTVAFRVILITVDDCYQVLDIIQNTYQSLYSEFEDYIKNPKPNGYKSLHIIVDLGSKNYCEVQIRTKEMHEFAEYGPPSHIYYKLHNKLHGHQEPISEAKIKMLQNMLKWQESIFSSEKETSVKGIEEEVLVFTPKGDLISLPKGSTPIDFAYSLHTDLGNKAVKALVNSKQASMSYVLKNGDVIEIITDNTKKYPSSDWLAFAKTKRAKIQIKKGIMKKTQSLKLTA